MSRAGNPVIPLRQRKAALTRLDLLNALQRHLSQKDFQQIKVKELCEDVGISEQTFFNYFHNKAQLLAYYAQLWSVDLCATTRAASGASGISIIIHIFDRVAEEWVRHPRLSRAVLMGQAAGKEPAPMTPPPTVDLLLRYPDRPGITAVEPKPVQELIVEGLKTAVQVGELPARVDLGTASRAMTAVFLGGPMIDSDPSTIKETFRQALDLIWTGLVARDLNL